MLRSAAMLLVVFAVSGCNPFENQRIGYSDCRPWGGSGWTHVVTDPNHCGRCNRSCGEGVPCVDSQCQLDTVMNCGEAGRVCVALDGEDVACVRFYEGDAAVGDGGLPPEGIELVDGYGCVPIEAGGDSGVEDGADAGVAGDPKRQDGRWMLIAGHTPACADGLETNGCVTAEVAVTDVCGATWSEPFAYDFAIMTREMSRGQFRELMCDCARPAFTQCVALCAERDVADAEALAERPMTGINWCEAYTACQRLGARLPTVRERARLEAQAEGPATLFGEAATCGAWLAETGRVPWLAECLELAPGDLAYDDVKGTAGQVLIGRGVLTEPEPVHHLVGNVDEWMADPASALRGDAVRAPGTWGLPYDGESSRDLRLLRGRSLFSPAGLPGARLLIVESGLKADDVGVRCARTTRAPYDEPVPYDGTARAREYAACAYEPLALRPVRRTVGEQVYRATDLCIDSEREIPADFRRELRARARLWFVDRDGHTSLARRVSAGQVMEVGPARFGREEQWWKAKPAAEPGDDIVVTLSESPFTLRWLGEEPPRTTDCAEQPVTDPTRAAADGRVGSRHALVLPQAQSILLGPNGAERACAHLDCEVPLADGEDCATACPGWILPLVFEFRQSEPAGRGEFCP